MTEMDLFFEYKKTKNIDIRNKIVEENLDIVNILVSKYLNKGIEKEDLQQVGAIALISAVERFDPDRGLSFSSFATPTILGEIKKHFRDKGWTLKVPRRLKELSSMIAKATSDLTFKLNRKPTVEELAQYLERDEQEIIMAMESSLAYGTFSLDETFEDSTQDGGSAGKFDKFTAFTEDGYQQVDLDEIIANVVDQMSETNKFIFRKRFVEEKTQVEIAEELGVSQMSVSRAEKKIKEIFAKELNK